MKVRRHIRAFAAIITVVVAVQTLSPVSAAELSLSQCEKCDFDTAINWVVDRDLAFELARREQRPVMVLHLSGNFAKPEFT